MPLLDDSSHRSNSGSPDWKDLPRQTAEVSMGQLPPLTVIASLPGWGATTWMLQLREYVQRDPSVRTVWATSRSAVTHALLLSGSSEVDVLFVDELQLTASDELWAELERVAKTPAAPKVVVTSLDSPPRIRVQDITVLTEEHLALTTDEINQLASINGVTAPPGLYSMLAGRYRGNPELARYRFEHLSSDPHASRWAMSDARLDVHFASRLGSRLSQVSRATRTTSLLFRVIKRAVVLRRFSLDHVVDDGDPPHLVYPHFARLIALPLGTVDVDRETGQQAFEWSEGVWSYLEQILETESSAPTLRDALATAQRTEHLSLQVYCLARLGELAAVESLISNNLRFFLIDPPRFVTQALTDLRWEQVTPFPNLMLLIGDQRVRATGYAQVAAKYFQAALTALDARQDSSPFGLFCTINRKLFASVSLGHRARSRRYLHELIDLLGTPAHPGLIATASHDPHIANRLAAELFNAYWAATQTDEHGLAIRVAAVMNMFANPRSRTALADQLTVVAAEVFAGTHSDRTSELGAVNTDPMLLVEVGEDRGALDAIRSLAERADAGPSRSGAEAFVLAVSALVAPHTLDRHKLRIPLDKSRAFWSDGKESTSVVASTALASLAIGDPSDAARLISRATHRDWYITTVDSIIRLATNQPGEAMAALENAGPLCEAPRAKAVVGVLIAVARLRLHNAKPAFEQLESTLDVTTPGLVRFALRFVTTEDFAALSADLTVYRPELAAIMQKAANDTRHLHRAANVKLTPIDGENLTLLRRGYTTAQIAQHRFVSVNTVRTQVRLLLRKLEVTSRAEAVAKAEQLGVFRTP